MIIIWSSILVYFPHTLIYYRCQPACSSSNSTRLTPSLLSQGGVQLVDGGRVHVFQHSGLHFLEIQDVRMEDAESYTCSVTNSAGTATATAQLSVQGREPVCDR